MVAVDPSEEGPYFLGQCRIPKFGSSNAEMHFRNWRMTALYCLHRCLMREKSSRWRKFCGVRINFHMRGKLTHWVLRKRRWRKLSRKLHSLARHLIWYLTRGCLPRLLRIYKVLKKLQERWPVQISTNLVQIWLGYCTKKAMLRRYAPFLEKLPALKASRLPLLRNDKVPLKTWREGSRYSLAM